MAAQQQNGTNGFHENQKNLIIHFSNTKRNQSTSSTISGSAPLSPSLSSVTGFSEGDDVLLKDKNDGLVYLGIAVEIDEPSGMCLVRFGDGAERWGRLGKEVKSLALADELDDDVDEITAHPTNGIHEEEPSPPSIPHVQSNKIRQTKNRSNESRGKRRSSVNSFPTITKETPAHVLRARKELPYDFESLLWDENHQRNDKER